MVKRPLHRTTRHRLQAGPTRLIPHRHQLRGWVLAHICYGTATFRYRDNASPNSSVRQQTVVALVYLGTLPHLQNLSAESVHEEGLCTFNIGANSDRRVERELLWTSERSRTAKSCGSSRTKIPPSPGTVIIFQCRLSSSRAAVARVVVSNTLEPLLWSDGVQGRCVYCTELCATKRPSCATWAHEWANT